MGGIGAAGSAGGAIGAGSSYICCATAKSSPTPMAPPAAMDVRAAVDRLASAAYSAATRVRLASSALAVALSMARAAATAAALAALPVSFFPPAALPGVAEDVGTSGADLAIAKRVYEAPGVPASSAASAKDAANGTTARRAASGCFIACNKYRPVCDSAAACTSATEPSATSRPPRLPALGPMSMMWSAWRMVSSSCSTTTNVLPLSLNDRKAPSKILLSRACRPIVGSSST